jgi:hypothetical protein
MKRLTNLARQKAVLMISNPYKCFSVKERIIDNLIQEVEHEKKEYKSLSKEEKLAFYKNTGFKLMDIKDTTRLCLYKVHKDFQVKLCFYSKSLSDDLKETESLNSELNSDLIEYKVIFNKIGNSGGFIVDAYSNGGTITINNLYFNEDIQAFYNKLISGHIDPDLYLGPSFTALDSRIQKAVYDLLIEFGINDECAKFIEVASIEKDQYMYINWLTKAKKCLL